MNRSLWQVFHSAPLTALRFLMARGDGLGLCLHEDLKAPDVRVASQGLSYRLWPPFASRREDRDKRERALYFVLGKYH